MRTLLSPWLGAALLTASCASVGRPHAFALYPHPEQPRDRSTLAQLQGPVGTVDGFDVEAYGTVFDLLPGCHVVGLRDKVGQNDVSGSWVGDLGPRYYAFRMRPGYLYAIDVAVRFRGASHGTMTITAEERDGPSGRLVQVVPTVSNRADIDACLDWQEAHFAQPP